MKNSNGAAPPKTLRIEVTLVTPKLAKTWLEKNHPKNRPINWMDVETYANDMRTGNWHLLADGICIGADDLVCNGQHRLHSIVLANVAVWMVVTWDPTATPQHPFDRNRVRALGQILGKRGRDIAALNTLRSFEQGFQLQTKMTIAEGEAVIGRHWGAIEQILAVRGGARLHGPVLAACAWALPCNPEKVLEFVDKVGTGEMIGRGSPAYAFRNWLERNKNAGSTWDKALAALNAIRYFVQDGKISSIFTGDSGYRAVVARRRALKVPSTPGTDLVTGVSWSI
jgi:hypothetical protein